MAVGSIVIMQVLARSKRRIATELNSGAVHADSLQSEICSYLAGILLAGLALNALFHWWWADPLAAHRDGAVYRQGRLRGLARECLRVWPYAA